MGEAYDYIIIGAGSAGCVLANRLSADKHNKVLVIEAGGKDRSPLIRMPAGVGKLISGAAYNWSYATEAQPHMDGRRLYWPRGKVLGGSSSINGMIYIRGHARDYDLWRQMGLEGWSYADVLPYFKRAECHEAGADPYHGTDGPLHVAPARNPNPLFSAFIEAGRQAGHAHAQDFNGASQEGVGRYELTIKKGRRCSAASAYLKPALTRPNLRIETHAQAARILFQGRRAVGVEYVKSNQSVAVRANAEVLISGGAVNTPQLLCLSGIGPGDHLRRLALPVIADLPGVGENLQDHLDAAVHYECTQPVTGHLHSPRHRMALMGLRFILFGSGPGTSNFLESGAFLRSRPELELPDLQLHFIAALVYDHARTPSDRHGFMCHVCQLRPESRGRITLASNDPLAHPHIQPNYLATENDRRSLRDGVRLTREIFAQRAFDPYRGAELSPGIEIRSDDAIDRFIREKAETIYHPVGTARMGHDRMGVVDAALRVHETEGLRVVDASVMPNLIGGNTNAPTIMIAEKAADMILGRSLPADALPPPNFARRALSNTAAA